MRTNAVAVLVYVFFPAAVLCAEAQYYTLAGIPGSPGSAGQPFLREDVKAYNGSLTAPDASLPSPRSISLVMTNDTSEVRYPEKRLSSSFHTCMLTYLGEMVSHDINRRASVVDPKPTDYVTMAVPPTDAYYVADGMPRTHTWNITRDDAEVKAGRRTAINKATAFVDLSCLYTTYPTLLDKMRRKDGTGELKMAANGRDLPLVSDVFTQEDLEVDPDYAEKVGRYPCLRVAGDVRGNMNPGALSIRTFFFRNHNRLARRFRQECVSCTEDDIFNKTRRWNIATWQAIVFYEYVPQLGIQLPLYSGYNPKVDPGIDNFFTTVAYRYGHSEVVDTFIRLNDNGTELEQGHIWLVDSWYKPELTIASGVESVIRGMAVQLQGEVEPHFCSSVQQHLMGPAYVNGSDLCATNIFRARDHGLPLYNDARKEFGLNVKATWADVTKDATLQQLLAQAYAPNGPDACDAYICGLAEPKLAYSHFGELFNASMHRQYQRLRDGDPLYFENKGPDGPGFTDVEINHFKSFTLRLLILNNTHEPDAITNLPANIWNTEGKPGLGYRGPGSSSNAGSTGAGSVNGSIPNRLEFKQGHYILSWAIGRNYIDITINTTSKGWIGFGIAVDKDSGMMGADMVIASKDSRLGAWKVQDYYSRAKALVPQPDTTAQSRDDVTKWEVRDLPDRTIVTFRRPLKASDGLDREITPGQPQTIILAWNPNTPIFGTPHFTQTRQMVTIDWVTGNKTNAAVEMNKLRQKHGVLMGFAFVLLYPLGALLIRALRYHFIVSKPLQAALFYCHPVVQIGATGLATWGFLIAITKLTEKKYNEVLFHHGTLGIAIMVLAYMQLFLGVIRPPGNKDGVVSRARRIWDVVHATFGRFVLLLGITNVFIGIHIYDSYANNAFQRWIGLCAASVVIIAWIQQFLDRMEMLYISRYMAKTKAAKGPGRPNVETSPQEPATGYMYSPTKDQNGDSSATTYDAFHNPGDTARDGRKWEGLTT